MEGNGFFCRNPLSPLSPKTSGERKVKAEKTLCRIRRAVFDHKTVNSYHFYRKSLTNCGLIFGGKVTYLGRSAVGAGADV
jgi:hypothetical protein